MGEEASDPRPELSGLHPFLVPGSQWIQRESEDRALGQNMGVGAGSGWTIVYPLLIRRLGQACTSHGDMTWGFLIKLQCLFHLRPYFLKMAFLELCHLSWCGLETSLLIPTPPLKACASLRPL